MSAIQPLAAGPSAEQCYFTWKAERDQLEAIYHDLTRRLDTWRSDQESQIHMECNERLRDIPPDSRVVHLMHKHIEDERQARLKKLQRDYQANKDEQEDGHFRELQAHTESFVKRVDSAMARVAPQCVQTATASDFRNGQSMEATTNYQPTGNQATNHPSQSAMLQNSINRHVAPTQAAYSLPSQTRGPAQAQARPAQLAFPMRAPVPAPESVRIPANTDAPTDTRRYDSGSPDTIQASQSQQRGDQREVALRRQINRARPYSPPRPSGQATPDPSAPPANLEPEQSRLFAALSNVSPSEPSLGAAAPPVVLPSQQLPPPSPPAHGLEHEVETLKRKAETQPSSAGRDESKKAKLAPTSDEEGPDRDGESAVEQLVPQTQKTISFDDVYQNGAPEHQAYHTIIEYPVGKGNWYILKCDEHGVYFNTNPLHGAAKHLHSPQHNMMSKEHSQAIAVLGYLVLGCSAELAAKNNAVVRKHFEEGHKPFNQNQLSKTERVRRGLEPPGTSRPISSLRMIQTEMPRPGSGRTTKTFSGITNPVPAELYLGYWSKNRTNYGVLVLPWHDLSPCGLSGHLKYTGLLSRAPKCYRITEDGDIAGWAEGYEDDGPHITKRDFPVMYFDGARSVGWLRARDLSSFPFEGGMPKEIPYYHEAKEAYANAKGFESYEAYKTKRRLDGLPEKVASDVAPSSSSVVETTDSSPTVHRYIDGSTEEEQPVLDSQPPGQKQAGSHSPDLAPGDEAVGEHDEHMSDMSPNGDDSVSNHDSDARAMSESVEDMGMHDRDSRRTSVSREDRRLGSERAKSPANKTETMSGVPVGAPSNALEASMTTAQSQAEIEAAAQVMSSPRSNGQVHDLHHDQTRVSTPEGDHLKSSWSDSSSGLLSFTSGLFPDNKDSRFVSTTTLQHTSIEVDAVSNQAIQSSPSPPSEQNPIRSEPREPDDAHHNQARVLSPEGRLLNASRSHIPLISEVSRSVPDLQDTPASFVAAAIPSDDSCIVQTDPNQSPQPRSQEVKEQPGLLSSFGSKRTDRVPGRSTRNTRTSIGEVSRAMSPSPSTPDTVIAKPKHAGPQGNNSVTDLPTTSPRPAKKGKPSNSSRKDAMSSPPTSSSIEVITVSPVPRQAGSSTLNRSPDQTEQRKEDSANSASRLGKTRRNDITTTRSSSHSPGAGVSGPASGTSTPTIIRPDATAQTGRWRAVRSESTNQESSLGRSAASTITGKKASRSPSLKPSKECSAPPVGDSISVAASTLSTPLHSANSLPKSAGNEERYEIAWYENSAGLAFHRKEDGPCLYLETNSQTRSVESSPGQAIHLKIEPTSIETMVVEPLDEAMDAVLVTLSRKAGAEGPKEEKLVFERSSIRGDDLIGRIHARYFVSWVNRHKASGQAIKYVNNSHDPLRRPVTSYVPRSSMSKAKHSP